MTAPLTATIKKQHETNAGAQLTFPLFIHLGTPSHVMVSPTLLAIPNLIELIIDISHIKAMSALLASGKSSGMTGRAPEVCRNAGPAMPG